MRFPARLLLLLLPLLSAVLASCTLQAKVTLTAGAAADLQAVLELKPPARQAWAALRDLDPNLPEDPLAPGLWTKGPGREVSAVPSAGGLKLTAAQADLRRYLPGLQAGDGAWDLTLDRTAVRKLAGLTAWAGSPALDSLLPAPGALVTEADYRDLLAYLLGPGLSDQAAKVLIDASRVELTVVAPRPIVSAPGAASVSGSTAVFRWPLVRALALEKPIRVRIQF